MQKKPNFLLVYLMLALSFMAIAQESLSNKKIGIGEWRVHLPYYDAQQLATDGNKIYCLTKGGLYFYSTTDNDIKRFSKIDGLSDIEINTISYSKEKEALLLGYKNGNIDLLINDKIINISDIKRKSIPGKKTINRIYFKNNYAYLACGFGIVVLDIEKQEIKDTYIIGPAGTQINVFDVASNESTIFAATEKGIYYANANNQYLSDYTNWTLESKIPKGFYNAIENFNDKIIANFSKKLTSGTYEQDTLYQFVNGLWKKVPGAPSYDGKQIQVSNGQLLVSYYNGALFLYNNDFTAGYINAYFNELASANDALYAGESLWIADSKHSLVERKKDGTFNKIIPNGPGAIPSVDMSLVNGVLWSVPGGKDDKWSNSNYATDTISFLHENEWKTKLAFKDSSFFDVECVAVNPNDPLNAFVGTWGRGVVEFKGGEPSEHYHHLNSSLRPIPSYYSIRIGGLAFDSGNNLWVTNSAAKNPLSVKTTDGTWVSFPFPQLENLELGKIITYNTQKWIQVRETTKKPSGGIVVYDDRGTPTEAADDTLAHLQNIAGLGNLPSNGIFSFAVDKDEEVWIGTNQGVAVIFSANNIFTGEDYDAQPITIEQDGYVQHLLETETITAIEVDGANRKWIGTANSGAYLMDSEGINEIEHFTTDNSPLLSNSILSIAIDDATGEVYFGTEKGLISYKGTATEGDLSCNSLYAFPNPVREDYTGLIGIKGMMAEADVKITDIVGNLVYKTKSIGGQAIWDGKNLDGSRVSTGVYMVFASTEDGSKSCVTKILIIN